jgi:ribose/xylose/arabinose/galactoside ABC-type transport system permease subunit
MSTVKEAQSAAGSRFSISLSSDVIVNNILLASLAVLIIYFSFSSSYFLTVSNFAVLLTNYAAIGVVAAIMTLLMIAGHVDLSVGSNIAFSAMMAALAITYFHLPPGLAIVIGVGTGACVGAVNGLLCGALKFSPIIVTLGMLSFLRGITLLINPTEVYGLGDLFFFIGNGSFLGVPVLLWAVALSFLASAIFISATIWGRYVYAIGVNPQAAFLAALPVKRLLFSLYVATGAAAGLAGVLLAARLDGVSPGALGLQMELQALTIILLGGVAFAGGRGRIFGVITAWVFLGVLENGLTLLNVPPFIQLVAGGMALIFAASIDAFGTYVGPRMARRRAVLEQIEAAKQQATATNSQIPEDSAAA